LIFLHPRFRQVPSGAARSRCHGWPQATPADLALTSATTARRSGRRERSARAYPAIGSTLFHYADGRIVRVSIRPSPGVDALYAPRRYLLDRILVDTAAEAGVDVLHETTVTAPAEVG
jgi:hypothetical protein